MTGDIQKITAYGLHPAPCHLYVDDLTPPDERQVDACRHWLTAFARPLKSISRRRGSYRLKHDVEAWTRGPGRMYGQTDPWGRYWTGDYLYIANGAFIEAAKREGYRMRREGPGSPNAVFNISVAKAGIRVSC